MYMCRIVTILEKNSLFKIPHNKDLVKNRQMPYNVISSLCIADPSPTGSVIVWAHVNKIKIN